MPIRSKSAMAVAPSPAREGACAPHSIREVVFILFGAQSDDRVHAAGPAGRQPGGQDGDNREEQADREIGLRVERTDPKKKTADYTSGGGDGQRAYGDANAKEPETVGQHQPADVRRAGPERETDRD